MAKKPRTRMDVNIKMRCRSCLRADGVFFFISPLYMIYELNPLSKVFFVRKMNYFIYSTDNTQKPYNLTI